MGQLAGAADTRAYAEERDEPPGFPPLVFHGGPALDHSCLGDRLDPL